MDKIYIRDLSLKTIIGIFPEERNIEQEVIFNIELCCDLIKAGISDDINDTVDYKTMKQKIIKTVKESSFQLIERLAEVVATICLENKDVLSVKVTVDKPGALRYARSVAVEIERFQNK